MTHDPPRWLESEQDVELLGLLRAGESELAPREALARVGARVPASGATQASGAGAARPRGTFFKVAIGIAALTAMLATQRWVRQQPAASPHALAPVQRPPEQAADPRASALPLQPEEIIRVETESARALRSDENDASAPRARAMRTRLPVPHPAERRAPADTRLEEARLLERARAELAQQPARTLAILREHERRFPATWLAEERAALSIRALVQTGETQHARTRFLEFKREFSGSAQVAALARALDMP